MICKHGGHTRLCSKRYSRPLQVETVVQEDGYPLYRRCAGGRTFIVRAPNDPEQQITIDNRWVVPYNPYLTMRYKAYINIEVCGSVRAVTYIHKYIIKVVIGHLFNCRVMMMKLKGTCKEDILDLQKLCGVFLSSLL